ncbi:MAG: TRAP transporter small permease [Desulfovibrionaceae bacterium]|nr:TRAP transporter small permease [Desulfovibrionaceae bacterium]
MANEQKTVTASAPKATEQTAPKQQAKSSGGRFLFELFCAAIFLGMIGLVTYNAFLRYAFRSSFPPSEEWARFLFIYVTFFGAIEAFYHRKHIIVDLVIDHLHGMSRKVVDVVAILISMATMGLLLLGGISYVQQTMDTYSVSTNINMAFINCTLPICAAAALVIFVRDLRNVLRTPAALTNPKKSKEERIQEFLKGEEL